MLPLKHPFTALVVGPTCCGKTQFVYKLIENVDRMIDPPSNRMVYCYGEIAVSYRPRAVVSLKIFVYAYS